MINLLLTRRSRNGNAVIGALTIPFTAVPVSDKPEEDRTYPTLENADCIIPAGTYPLVRTYSPRFKKLLPLVEQVPDREGIRIHRGSIPEHTQGCILVDMIGQSALDALFNRITKFYNDEKVTISISDDYDLRGRVL